ncbi:hypothetical protein ACT3CD_17125 [Geofilum sp. OHC36d9]|uniref:hypothetical protein n=1 Tax=Geofilum sp. OHC36d9 TaxID=3458413 RepID=UPI0040348A9F
MAEIINITPYSKIENRQLGVCEIVISEGEFKGKDYKAGRSTFVFENCDFTKIIIKNTESIDFKDISICFSSCFIRDITVERFESENISLSFFSSIISGNINDFSIRSIIINNCLIASLFLQYQKKVQISCTEENIFPKKWKPIFDRMEIPSIEEFLQTKQSIFINHSEEINIYGSSKQKELRSGLYRREYESAKDMKIGYYLTDEQKSLLQINLSITYSNNVRDLNTNIKNLNLNSLSISGNAKGNISIEQLRINGFYIFDFSTEKEALLYSISPYRMDSKLSIHKSNLDNTSFDNIDISGFSIVSLYRSRFAKSHFSSCEFPQKTIDYERFQPIENVQYPNDKPENYYKDQYEVFLQLKQSLEETGNYFEALKLKAITKEALRKVESVPKSDKLILRLNYWSNKHSLSISRPFYGLLIFSILFYLLYLLSIDRIFISTEFDWTLVGHYFSFIDITHKKDFLIPKNEFNIWSLTIDFLNKIVTGFFIYQFIAAFRKYGKK